MRGSIFPCLLILITFYPFPSRTTAGWLRFCASGATFRASAVDCTGGYWLKKTATPQCVCAHGIWILSKGYCDPNFAIVVGVEGTCFAFSTEVRWIRMVGIPDNPFAPYYFISNKGFDKVEAVASSATSKQLTGRSIYAGAINPSRSLQSTDGTVCLKPKRVELSLGNGSQSMNDISEDAVREVRPDGFSFGPIEAEEKSWSFQQLSVCEPHASEFAYVYGVKPNQFYHNNELVNSSAIPNTCNTTCIADNEPIPGDDDDLTTEKPGNGTVDDGDEPSDEVERPEAEFEKPCVAWDPKWNAIPNRTEMEIREQSKRLAITQINYSLFKHTAPVVNLTEYKMFQKARRVMEKVCPKDEVPPLFLRGVLRMFRHALNESHESYPYRTTGDELETTRIMDALTKCYEDPQTQPMKFIYNETVCPKKFSVVVVVGADQKPKKVASATACLDRFNYTGLDYIVEVAWKVVLFSHYFCARHFNSTSYDHSRFMEKLSLFFNREIQHRWFHPGKSLDVMNYVFRTYDLQKIAFGLDRCVGAARSSSPYRKWVLRPKFEQYCWADNDYNGNDPANNKNANSSLTPYLQTTVTWEGTAYCLNSWKDPITIMSGYKADAKSACDKEGSANIFV